MRAALALEPGERTEIVEAFFTTHPGGGSGPLGLGRAVADFVDWEIRSGRITDGGGGSAWWRLVNGAMVLDMRDAAAVDADGNADGAGADGAVGSWIAYIRCDGAGAAQETMWTAHQGSLHAGLHAADRAALLADERHAEREFAGLVVEIVNRTAAHHQATDTADLARMTARSYPQQYPITPQEWAALHARFAPLL